MKKFTKIVATISDRRCDVEFIRRLFENGMNVVRMNSAHLSREGFVNIVKNVRAVSQRIAIMMDTKGPEIRTTATVADEPISFVSGQRVNIIGNPDLLTTAECIYLNYSQIASDVTVGQHFLIDDGELDFLITAINNDGTITAVSQNDGVLGSRKSVNIPGSNLSLPAISERDRQNIAIAVELGIDFIAHSFVRSRADVEALHELIGHLGGRIQVISKIENQQGVDNFDEILDASYGIMIARGDLGIEVAAERIPGIQNKMIRKCIAAHKPVIVATQMLHSMINNPRPTRAEVSDIANAVYQRADALMLSGETAKGRYPVEAIATMSRVAMEMERTLSEEPIEVPPLVDAHVTSFLARQAVVSERMIGTKAIVTDSNHGRTARYIASFRGNNPVIAVCYNETVSRCLNLSYGITAFYSPNKRLGHHYPTEELRRFVALGLIKIEDRIAYLGALNGTGATFLEINSVDAIIANS